MPLPHFELSSSQYRILAEASLRPLPDPANDEAAQQEWIVRELDPEGVQSEVSELVFLGLVVREGSALALTALGSAVHHRAGHEAAEERLAAVARLAEAMEDANPRLARTVRQLVQGSISLGEALARAARRE
ncbi:hypothetical protein [Streptomyces xylophagus]|uniref:hypothetical protein n=1 Tax=Streptomyces xylophagus TaxID=285514 RepID=UPI0005BC5C9A|nr:hypothetical protein [Streptomyces xylophagus]